MIRRLAVTLILLIQAIPLSPAFASPPDEGMWLLDAIQKLPLAGLKQAGYELSAEKIYSEQGQSLKDAIVLLPGGTGAFVSGTGLILTNHHIAFAGIQEVSSVTDDYLKNGFHARSRDEELSTSYTAEIMTSMKDVTASVVVVVRDTMEMEARAEAIKRRIAELEKQSLEKNPGKRVQIVEMYHGGKYYEFVYESLKDIRLVYAPPEAVGVYGGEVDNWIWPRHTGDFAFLRAYVGKDGKPAAYSKDNIPYKARTFLPFSSKGVPEGSFAMVMGYPGRTFRYREHAAVQIAFEETLPLSSDLYKQRMDIIESFSRSDRAVGIGYATKLRRLANTYKNYEGTMEGMRRSDLLKLRKAELNGVAAFIATNPTAKKKYGTVIDELEAANQEFQKFNRKNILFTNLLSAVEMFGVAERLMRYGDAFKEDAEGGLEPPPAKEADAVRKYVQGVFKDINVKVDQEMMVAMILAGNRVPYEHRIEAFGHFVDEHTGMASREDVREFVHDLYESSMLTSTEGVTEAMSADDPGVITNDPFVELARTVYAERNVLTQQVTAHMNRLNQLRGKYVAAYLEWKKNPNAYPDANRTLRWSYGTVRPLAPRDAVTYSHVTTLTGVIEKDRGEEPFEVPQRLREIWKKKDFGVYADRKLNDVPVAFIANLDITGGSSGSPVINGKGELIGCAFDGNWEAVVGDYYYDDRLKRCISVDARYVLFILDKFSNAQNILRELTVR